MDYSHHASESSNLAILPVYHHQPENSEMSEVTLEETIRGVGVGEESDRARLADQQSKNKSSNVTKSSYQSPSARTFCIPVHHNNLLLT